jgi:hypothetical protein
MGKLSDKKVHNNFMQKNQQKQNRNEDIRKKSYIYALNYLKNLQFNLLQHFISQELSNEIETKHCLSWISTDI